MNVLLAAALVLTVVLVWEAVDAARSHRAAVEKVLRDDAALAANEYLRRARYQVSYFAFYPALRIVADFERATGGLPDVGALASTPPIAPLSFIRTVASVNLINGRVTSSPLPSGELAAWLDENLARLVRERASPLGDLAVSRALVGGQTHTFVYGRSPSASLPRGLMFDVDLAALGPSWRKALDQAPLLPEPIASAAAGGDSVFLELSDSGGRPLLTTEGRFDPALGVSQTIRGAADVLDGLTIRASIAPAAAQRLVAGGLPPSRLSLLLVAGALAAGLLVASIVLARRERAVARLRAEFVASVSHELRTPLAQIRLFAETLRLDRVRTPEERRRALEIIDQEARRLTQLVQNALAFSNSDRAATAIAPREQDVSAIAREAIESFAPLAAAAGARLAVELPESAVAAVDADALRQVLVNLLDNAAKYGPSGQCIAVRLEQEAGWLFLSVEDQGPGVPVPDRDRIFERFVRLDRDRASHIAGAGIGLCVALELVRLHGGTIRAESSPRGGARFVVALPAESRRGP